MGTILKKMSCSFVSVTTAFECLVTKMYLVSLYYFFSVTFVGFHLGPRSIHKQTVQKKICKNLEAFLSFITI